MPSEPPNGGIYRQTRVQTHNITASVEIDIQFDDASGVDAAPGDYGEWTDDRFLDDRSA
jgi:hypothetical protein